MATMPTRGDCWIVDLGMVAKVRPCLILSIPADDDNDRVLMTYFNDFTVAYVEKSLKMSRWVRIIG